MANELDAIMEERGKQYGDYGSVATMSQTLKRAMCAGPGGADRFSSIQLESIDMICHKMARIAVGNPNNKDSWRDIAGYATLVADRLT